MREESHIPFMAARSEYGYFPPPGQENSVSLHLVLMQNMIIFFFCPCVEVIMGSSARITRNQVQIQGLPTT